MVIRIETMAAPPSTRPSTHYWILASSAFFMLVFVIVQTKTFNPYGNFESMINDAPTILANVSTSILLSATTTTTSSSSFLPTSSTSNAGAPTQSWTMDEEPTKTPKEIPDPKNCINVRDDDDDNTTSSSSHVVAVDGNNYYTHHQHRIGAHVNSKWTHFMLSSNDYDSVSSILGRTMCHPKGRFRTLPVVGDNNNNNIWDPNNEELVEDWEIKLLYLAIHDLFHNPARDEYEQRCHKTDTPYQFTCPNAKFLVTAMPVMGLGAVIRLSTIAHMAAAIASDRIPVFVANLPNTNLADLKIQGEIPKWESSKWQLASCPQGDMHCIYMPTSPCQLTLQDLANATVLEENYANQLRRGGHLDKQFENHRILHVFSRIQPAKVESWQGMNRVLHDKLYKHANKLIDGWVQKAAPTGQWPDGKLEVLRKAADLILTPNNFMVDRYNYGHRRYRMSHAMQLYLMRPNEKAAKEIRRRLQTIIPSSFNPRETIGMPVRGSDKCDSESTCLPFEKYMNLANETWHNSTLFPQSGRGKLIFTTEDKKLFLKSANYQTSSDFPLDFIVNSQDVFQGSGAAHKYGTSADEVMLSTLTAMQMQFHAGHVFGNCCSNFHIMLFDFLFEGCGLSHEVTCLQETKDYNVCCAWVKSEECEEIRKDFWEAQKQEKAS